ncbi:MAG: hypothetical protein V1494_01110 [Candidatus Diapherotrites archaeon]
MEKDQNKGLSKIEASIFRQYEPILAKDCVYNCLKETLHNGQVIKENLFNCYECYKGKGQNRIILITQMQESLPLGEIELCFAPLKIMETQAGKEFELIEEFKPYIELYGLTKISPKNLIEGIKEEAVEKEIFLTPEMLKEKIWEGLKDIAWGNKEGIYSKLFYKKIPPVDINAVLRFSNKEANEKIDAFIDDNCNKDPVINYLFKHSVLFPNINVVKPHRYQPFNPHQILITNSGTAKTTTAEKFGRVYENASIIGLVGYADAQKICYGTLHNSYQDIALDELEAVQESDIYSKFLKILQDGKTTSAKAGREIPCRSWSPLRIMSNPVRLRAQESLFINDYELVQIFEDLINCITKNPEALGNRIPIVLFSKKIKALKKGAAVHPLEEIERLQKYVQTLGELAKTNYSRLFNEQRVVEWLRQGYPEQYEKEVKALAASEEDAGFQVFRDFLNGSVEGSGATHCRGFALKQACVDSIMDLINGRHDIGKLLKDADFHFQKILGINLKSFESIVEITQKQNLMAQLVESRFHALAKEGQILCSVLKQFLAKELPESREIITDSFQALLLENEAFKGTGRSLPTYWSRLFKQRKRLNLQFMALGFELGQRKTKVGMIQFVKILDEALLKLLKTGEETK